LNGHARVLDQDKVIVRNAVKGGVLVIDHPEVTGHYAEILVTVRHAGIVQKLASVRRVVKDEVSVIDHHEVIGHHVEVLVIVRHVEIVQKLANVRHALKDGALVIVLRGHRSALAGNVPMAGGEIREDRAVHLPPKAMTSTA
jgi:phosphohistidine swiveling domain-containing protein